jgi:hypothetical protein
MFLVVPSLVAGPINDSVDRVVARAEFAGFYASFDYGGFQDLKAPDGPKERFFGTTNMVLTGGVFLTGVADIESTFACIGAHGSNYICSDRTAFYRPLVGRGRFYAYVGRFGSDALSTVPPYFMRRSEKKSLKVVGYIIPVVAIVVQSVATRNNIRNRNIVLSSQR